MEDRVIRRYSQAFKRQVVEEIESGKFDSVSAAGLHHGIGGATTVRDWVRKFGKNHLLAKVVRLDQVGEADVISDLRRQIERLQKSLGQTQAQNPLNGEYLKLACERMGEEVTAGMTRQNYYRQRRLRERLAVDESLVLELICRERCRQPRIGTRKLLVLIDADLKSAGVEMGVTGFSACCRVISCWLQPGEEAFARPAAGLVLEYIRTWREAWN